MNKSFIVIVIIIILGFGAYYIFNNPVKDIPEETKTTEETQNTQVVVEDKTQTVIGKSVNDETNDWDNYIDEKRGFVIKYPSDYKLEIKKKEPEGNRSGWLTFSVPSDSGNLMKIDYMEDNLDKGDTFVNSLINCTFFPPDQTIEEENINDVLFKKAYVNESDGWYAYCTRNTKLNITYIISISDEQVGVRKQIIQDMIHTFKLI